jgi:hypothetical protein
VVHFKILRASLVVEDAEQEKFATTGGQRRRREKESRVCVMLEPAPGT